MCTLFYRKTIFGFLFLIFWGEDQTQDLALAKQVLVPLNQTPGPCRETVIIVNIPLLFPSLCECKVWRKGSHLGIVGTAEPPNSGVRLHPWEEFVGVWVPL